MLGTLLWLQPGRPFLAARHPAVVASQPSPDEWREFRAQLVAGGLRTTEDEETDPVSSSAGFKHSGAAVAPKNAELLKEQNADLWAEYMNGAWAHPSPVEPGGLLCRMPLPHQFSIMTREAPDESFWSERLRQRVLAGLPAEDDQDASERERLFEQFAGNTQYMYRAAEAMVEEGMEALIALRATNGRVEMSALNAEERELVKFYSGAADTWQQVCLVLSGSAAGCDAVALNRPLAMRADAKLSALLLNGASGSVYDDAFIERFRRAFGSQGAVYIGGPDAQGAPALVVHGFDLPGASELSPGTRIYTGGVEAAVDGVLDGTYSPLDFRWFIGKHSGVGGSRGEWCSVACARPIALKQCIGLPKPLWHEVLELCGGEWAEISRIELLKRDDLEK